MLQPLSVHLEKDILNALASVQRGESGATSLVTQLLDCINTSSVKHLGYLLTTLLQHENDQIKVGCVEAFSRTGYAPRDAIRHLVSHSRHASQQLREVAVRALTTLPQDDAFFGLVTLLKESCDADFLRSLVPALCAHIERKSSLLQKALDDLKFCVDFESPPFPEILQALNDATFIRTRNPFPFSNIKGPGVPHLGQEPAEQMKILSELHAHNDERLRRIENLLYTGIDFDALLDMEAQLAVERDKALEAKRSFQTSLNDLSLAPISFTGDRLVSFLEERSRDTGPSPGSCVGLAIHLTNSLRGSANRALKEQVIEILDAMDLQHRSGQLGVVVRICKHELRREQQRLG